ncbi:MAG TPA: 3-dehydroquinate synthase [Rhizomicrobium sp.]|nr:3-dehydroquinate synthase [Rhizomicrobium sp.]
MSERVTVELGERGYDIHIGAGLLARAAELLKPFARGVTPVVADENVGKLHLDPLVDALRAGGIDARPVLMPAGEATKSFASLEKLVNALLIMGVERDGLIVALGGGVIGDLTGFAAGVTKRGIGFAQVPTTLLAQVDSSVGGKTAINTPEGKNLVGMFHQPRIVIADVGVLSTLPEREFLAGYAEVAKYGALGDAEFFAWLEQHGEAAIGGDLAARTHIVKRCCEMKAQIVARDERETGERALLNLGHTFGHALEAATGYSDRLLHGEAVAIGMGLAFRLSARLGLAPASDAARIEAHLRKVGLPAALPDLSGPRLSAGVLIRHMMHDKKARDGKLTFILARGIGRAFVTGDVRMDDVQALLAG